MQVGSGVPDIGVDPDDWRDYRILTDLHLTPDQAADMSAVKLDWLLAIHATVTARANASSD